MNKHQYMMVALAVVSLFLVITPIVGADSPVGKKVALVIGNSNYHDGDDVSGVEDANAMADALDKLNFMVLPAVLDRNLADTKEALRNFEEKIKDASVVIFFYSGHGFQLQGRNYLLPIGGAIDPSRSLPLNDVMQLLGSAPNGANKFVFLDACRTEKQLPRGALQGLANPSKAPAGVLQSFAASPGQVATSGSTDERSPYTTALLRYIREPGLEIGRFFAQVRADVVRDSPRGQQPIEEGAMPQGFYFKAPVFLRATVEADGDLAVLLNGEIVLSSSEKSERPLRLKAGKNDLWLLMSKGKSYHNSHSWDVTEGWSYNLKLGLSGPGEIPCSGPGRGFCFSDHENTPFKDGPHHGKTFLVAKATIYVNPETSEVTLPDSDTDIWNRDALIWARDQELLYDERVTSLNLKADDILDAIGAGDWKFLLRPVVDEFLRSGKIFTKQVADPTNTFATVYGNKVLRSAVQFCMNNQRAERLKDLNAGLKAAFARVAEPFKAFDQSLSECVRTNAGSVVSDFPADHPLIWTAIQEGSHAAAAPLVNAGTPIAGRIP